MATAFDQKFDIKDSGKSFDYIQPVQPHDLSLLVIGASGSGKSSFANFLSKTTNFLVGDGLQSITSKASCLVTNVLESTLMIIDSPGFMDNMQGDEKVFDEICKVNMWACQGISAIAIVIDPFSRINPDLINHLNSMAELGGDLWNHSFIIFPKEKKMLKKLGNKDTGREYINNAKLSFPKDMLVIIEKVGGRYVCVESKNDMEANDYEFNKKNEIIAMIKQISFNTEGLCKMYSNQMMHIGIKAFQKLREIRNEKLLLQGQISSLKDKIDKLSLDAIDFEQQTHALKDQIKDKEEKIEKMEIEYESKIQWYKDKLKEGASSCTII